MASPKPSNLTNLNDLLDAHGDALLAGLNCHAIFTTTLFNPLNQTVQGVINYPKLVAGNWVRYPAVVDAPAVIMSGGGATLTFPIGPGETGILLFNDRAISRWFKTGMIGPLPKLRLHDFADGMALLGIRSAPQALKTYDMLHALLSFGVAQLGVSATQVRAANALTTLGTVLNGSPGPTIPLGGLIPALLAFCTACAGSSDPTLVAAAGVLKLAINTPITGIAALTGGLLE